MKRTKLILIGLISLAYAVITNAIGKGYPIISYEFLGSLIVSLIIVSVIAYIISKAITKEDKATDQR